MTIGSVTPAADESGPPGLFRLAAAEVDGRATVLVSIGTSLYRLDDLVSDEVVPDELHEILAEWDRWHPLLTAAVSSAPADGRPVEPDRWLLPVRPSKLVCIGTNYHDHIREMGTPVPPTLPFSFLKPVSTGLVPSGAPVACPAGAKMVDWEAELAVVIGRRLHGGRGAAVLEAIAGYTILNDVSARDWIATSPAVGIDWVLMKGWDGFSPVGPFVTPREFVRDPQALGIRLWVNGELKQDSNTSQMIFGIQAILEHIAGIMTLEPGDVIATGTPAGVGFGQVPQQFLRPGDVVTIEVEGLGRLETPMVAPPEGAAV